MNKEQTYTKGASEKSRRDSVKHILLKGVFWRILVIEGILLVWSVFYMFFKEEAGGVDLLWYTLRIVVLVGIIILFMMVSLRSFLTRKVIASLEAIDLAIAADADDVGPEGIEGRQGSTDLGARKHAPGQLDGHLRLQGLTARQAEWLGGFLDGVRTGNAPVGGGPTSGIAATAAAGDSRKLPAASEDRSSTSTRSRNGGTVSVTTARR